MSDFADKSGPESDSDVSTEIDRISAEFLERRRADDAESVEAAAAKQARDIAASFYNLKCISRNGCAISLV